jgi:hypothetical protein
MRMNNYSSDCRIELHVIMSANGKLKGKNKKSFLRKFAIIHQTFSKDKKRRISLENRCLVMIQILKYINTIRQILNKVSMN